MLLFLNSMLTLGSCTSITGGTVHDYGLASSPLSRLRDEPQITLSVCVDRVAASGTYFLTVLVTEWYGKLKLVYCYITQVGT